MKCIVCKKEFKGNINNTKLTCSYKCQRERKRATDRVWNRQRSQTPHRKQWWLSYLEKNRDKIREKNRKAYRANKDKISAISKLKRKLGIDLEKRTIRAYSFKYLKDKLIRERKQCEICGLKENLDLHHKEYKNSVKAIILVCRRCHKLIHTRGLKEAKKIRGFN